MASCIISKAIKKKRRMTSPIEKLVKDIETLETERDTIYKRFDEIRLLLDNYKTILAAFNLVSTDPDLYDKWVITVNSTEKPKPPVVEPRVRVIPEVSNITN